MVEIRKLVDPKSWRHVPTNLNPADVLSRGCLSSELTEMTSWWHCPDSLHGDESNWPKNAKFQAESFVDQSTEFKEVQPVSATLIQVEKSKIGKRIDCENYSDNDKLVRVTCYVVCFAKNLQKKEEHRPSSLELRNIIGKQNILRRSFVTIKDAQKIFRAEPNFKQRERSLQLFHDYDGILKTQGRLDYSQLSYSVHHPAVL